MIRLVFYHGCNLHSVCVFCFFFYLTVRFAYMICFWYNVCDCHAIIKGNLLTYLVTLLVSVLGCITCMPCIDVVYCYRCHTYSMLCLSVCGASSTKLTGMEAARGNSNVQWTIHMMMTMMSRMCGTGMSCVKNG